MEKKIEFDKKEWLVNIAFIINEHIIHGKNMKLFEQLLVLIEQKVRYRLDKQKSEIKEILKKKFPCEFIKEKKALRDNFNMEFKKGHCLCDNCHLVKDILKELNK